MPRAKDNSFSIRLPNSRVGVQFRKWCDDRGLKVGQSVEAAMKLLMLVPLDVREHSLLGKLDEIEVKVKG